MKAFLLQDIRSYGKDNRLYGKKGDKVEIISEPLPALIVELNGKRFPVHVSEVSNYK